MARLRKGDKASKERRIQRLLHYYEFGLRESEIASELGWQRRTVNNYLRSLREGGKVYKEGREWFVDT